MEHLKISIEETIQIIENTARLFYQQRNPEGIRELDKTVNHILHTVEKILDFQNETKDRIFEDQIFNTVLAEAMKAMEQKDMVLFADIMVFEINDIFRECLNKLI